jgi:4-hydroxythreonine-4-phosphate dehydrogenase
VNYTAGLNKIRTSPDGTAYDIAGKGIADHNSLRKRFICFRYLSFPNQYGNQIKPLKVRKTTNKKKDK